MYTKEQQIRKAQKIGEHEVKRKIERKIVRGLSGEDYSKRKYMIAKGVALQQGVAHEIGVQKKMIRMDSINRKGRK